MSFKNPEFLFALFALLIPVIIHLFNFRRYKKVLFSNIELLKTVTAETKKQNEIKHLLVLLTRMLTILMIVLAFAGPEFGDNHQKNESGNPKTIFIYLDNSFSMDSQNEKGRLFSQALQNARNLVNLSPNDARFVLINNNSVSENRFLSKENILSELDQLQLTSRTQLISSVIRAENKIAKDNEVKDFDSYLFSDFQKSTTDIEKVTEDSVGWYYYIPVNASEAKNIYPDSCWLSSPVIIPGKKIQLNIRLKNSSSSDYEKVPLKLSINGEQKGITTIDLKAKGEDMAEISFVAGPPGWYSGEISIEDFPNTFDDHWFFAFEVNSSISVLEIYDEQGSDVLKKFYSSDSIFRFSQQNYRQIDFSSLSQFNLIILNGLPVYSSGLTNQMSDYVKTGGNLFFIPADVGSLLEINTFLQALQAGLFSGVVNSKTKVVRINQQNELFRESVESVPENPDLPLVNQYFKLDNNVSTGIEPLIVLLNGDGFLFKKNIGKGTFYILTVPLDQAYSNFSVHPLFVPVMFGAAISGSNFQKLNYTIGISDYLVSDVPSDSENEIPFKISQNQSDFSFIPEQLISSGRIIFTIHGNIEEDGIYNLVQNEDSYDLFAFNYDRKESNLETFTANELEENLSRSELKNFKVLNSDGDPSGMMVNALEKESDFWKLFVIFALLMILIEIMILRYWK